MGSNPTPSATNPASSRAFSDRAHPTISLGMRLGLDPDGLLGGDPNTGYCPRDCLVMLPNHSKTLIDFASERPYWPGLDWFFLRNTRVGEYFTNGSLPRAPLICARCVRLYQVRRMGELLTRVKDCDLAFHHRPSEDGLRPEDTVVCGRFLGVEKGREGKRVLRYGSRS